MLFYLSNLVYNINSKKNMIINFKRKFDKFHYWNVIKSNLNKNNERSNIIVYDIGANKGDWSKAALKFLNVSKIYAFEPIPEMRRFFNSNKIEIFSELLSDTFEKVQFHFSSDLDGSTGPM